MAKINILEYDLTAANNTDINSITIQGTSPVSNFDNAFRELMAELGAAVTRHVAKVAGSYTAVKADHNQLWRATGAATFNLTAAATLTTGWALWVKGDGGAITIDPAGAETINGAATLTVPNGGGAFIVCTGTAFFAISFGIGDVTLTGTQTLTNKTLTSPTINTPTITSPTITTPTLTLKNSAAPAPTATGDLQFGTTNNVLTVGDGAATQTFLPIPAGTAAGDIEYYTAAQTLARLAKGTASQYLQMNAGATAPQWSTLTVDYGAGNAALAAGAVGTYGFFRRTTSVGVNPGDTIAGASLTWSNANGDGTGTSPSGTWRAVGFVFSTSSTGPAATTTWLRIS